MSLPFEPACLPLLLGGLPHHNAAQAFEMSRRYAGALLAWPQLPRRSFREESYVQSMQGFPGLVVDASQSRLYVDRRRAEQEMDALGLAYLEDRYSYTALSADAAAGLDELLRQGESLRTYRALKGQLMGPISLAAQITDEHDRPLIYDDMLFDALVQHLELRAEWQQARLSEWNPTTIICVDEPFLEMVGLPFVPIDWARARQQINQVLDEVRSCKALFAGGACDWPEVLQLAIDMLIANVADNSASLVAAAPALAEFFERDGMLGLGLVPADEEAIARASAEHLAEQASNFAGAITPSGHDVASVLRRCVVSTAGTISRMSVAGAERAMQLVAEISTLLREQYGLDRPNE